MIDLEDIRQDIIAEKEIPKVIYVYREDTQETQINFLKPSSEFISISFNSDALPYSLNLELVSTTDTTSVWKLVIPAFMTTVMQPKTHNFTITVELTSGQIVTLYKGLLVVNNRVFSNYANNAFVAPVLKTVAPTELDSAYLNGSFWIDTVAKRVYVLINNTAQNAVWEEIVKRSVIEALELNDVLQDTRLGELEPKVQTLETNVTDLQNTKVPKTTTIIGLDLQDNILIGEFRTALGNATQSAAGLLSAEDKTHLDVLVALLENSDGNNVVDTIGEILAIFNNYPEGAELVTVLQGKVDKVAGKGLSTNDFTDALKNKLETLETSKQDKLVAGDNITIDEDNVISASGGEVDLNEMAYLNYASRIYGDKYSLLANAWGSSLAVDPSEIIATSAIENPRGKAQYPNGETEGVIIPQGVTTIGRYAFFYYASNNQPLVIPNSVTSIGYASFSGWGSNNQLLVIPNSVTSIGEEAFTGWKANNHPLVIPNSVTSIGDTAFRNWESNTHPLVIPDSVTSIENAAFRNWEAVPYVEIQAITPPTLGGALAFAGQNDAPIYVPDESVDDYKEATNWEYLADRIFPISDMTSDSVLSDRVDDLEVTLGNIDAILNSILGV